MSSASGAVLGAIRAFARRPSTTLARLQLLTALLAVVAIAFGVVAAQAAHTRRDAVASVVTNERLLGAAVELSASLSDAHAIAALSFLAPGSATVTSRADYAAALRRTSTGVTRLAAEIGASGAGASAVRRIARRLSIYAEYVQGARDNTRQGAPVGSAYLRAASRTRAQVLLDARELYEIEATNLTASYRAALGSSTVVAIVIAGGALLVVLTATQIYLFRATRRIVNPRMLSASATLLGLVVWILVAFAGQERMLRDTQARGSDPIELLTASSILASRAQAHESTALAARGGGEGEPRLADVDRGFQALTKPIPRLLAQAGIRAGDPVERAYRIWLAAHAQVVSYEVVGNFKTAIERAVHASPGLPTTKLAAAALNRALKTGVERARQRFQAAASSGRHALRGLAVGIPLVTALATLLALSGMRQRLEEYQ